MRRLLFSSLFSTLVMLGLASATPVLAHDASFTASANDDKQDKEARSEAGQLTDELRAAAARSNTQPAIQAAVADKAERRRTLVNHLAQTSPSAVLDLALTPAERAALPASIQSSVEERVDIDGELQVLHVDFEDGHSAYESKVVKAGRETPVTFGASLGNAKPGDLVRSNGVALAGDSTVVTDQMVVIQTPTSVGTTGIQRTAIILLMAPGIAAHPYADKTNTASLFFHDDNNPATSEKSARAFYLEASYGQTSIVGANGAPGGPGDVYGPYSIGTSSCGSSDLRTAAIQASDADVNFSVYDRVVLSIIGSCGNGGIGTIRTQGVSTQEGTQRLSISWDFGNALGETTLNGKIGGVALHEYGHNVGVWHASALECGIIAIGSGTCATDEYGDPSDVMGSSGGRGHPNGVHKDILGWLGTRAQDASTSTTYTVNAYEDGTDNVKVLRVPRTRDSNGTVNGHYYLEYRKPTEHWNTFATSRPDYGNGVLVHTSGATPLCTNVCNPDFSGGGGGGDSNIIDTQPASFGTNDLRDAPLLENESYVDVGAGVTIQVTDTSPTSATVSLSFTTPQRSIQTVVYPAGAGSVSGGGTYAPGQSVTLTASPAGCFAHWRETRAQRNYANPYTFTVGADRMLEAVFNTGACAAPPTNDGFSGPTISSGQQTVNTSAASVQSGEPTTFSCGGPTIATGRTAWYTITPASTSQIALTTVGSTFDTVLAVYTGSAVNGLTPVTCNDNVGGGTTSQVQFTGQAGTSYRVQLGGFNAEGGNGVLNVTASSLDSDPRQEGPIQVSGNQAVGGNGTITVSVKNYGTVPTPAIHPLVDGTTPAGQTWRADNSQPASASIQPGQTAVFTLQQPLTSPGTWTTTGVSLWNDTTGALWKALPANGRSQQVTIPVTMSCADPRPRVAMQTALSGDGRMAVTLTAGSPETGNRLQTLQFGADARTPNPNALVDLPGIGNDRTAPSTVAVPGAPASYTFYMRRQTANTPLTLPLTVTDYCGDWQTMVGAGTGAGF